MLVATKKRPSSRSQFSPANSFQSTASHRDRPREEFAALDRVAEGMRAAQVRLVRGDVRGAHAVMDELAKEFSNQTRYADISVLDVGACPRLARELDDGGTHTLSDIANSDPGKLAARSNLLAVCHVAIAAIRHILTEERQRAG